MKSLRHYLKDHPADQYSSDPWFLLLAKYIAQEMRKESQGVHPDLHPSFPSARKEKVKYQAKPSKSTSNLHNYAIVVSDIGSIKCVISYKREGVVYTARLIAPESKRYNGKELQFNVGDSLKLVAREIIDALLGAEADMRNNHKWFEKKYASELRSKLIRLAHNNPELRADLLPLLKKD